MEQIKIPDGYHSALNLHDTQIAIKTVKDFFQQTLAQKLNLLRVSAPVFVNPSSGLVCAGRPQLLWCSVYGKQRPRHQRQPVLCGSG